MTHSIPHFVETEGRRGQLRSGSFCGKVSLNMNVGDPRMRFSFICFCKCNSRKIMSQLVRYEEEPTEVWAAQDRN